MKKDEIVVLSNDIEIINGIEIDWSKYKGKDNNRARKSYIGLCELLQRKGHILESNYINNTTKVDINFKCGHKPHSIRPNDYKTGYGCPKCGFERIIELKIEKSKQDLYNLAKKNNHTILGEYIDAKTPILIDFNCGHKPHIITPDNYKNGKGCPICSGNSPEYAKEELYRIAEERGHKILREYKDNKTKILIDFNCGHKPHNITPNHYKQGQGCPECAIKNKMDKSKEELYNLAENNGHTILGEYINNKTKILIDFNCGHKPHSIRPNDYKTGYGCPICKSSKGEKEVARILKEMNINYQEQHKFDDCICVKPLPFDFYIPEFNMCIEYDGEFHYKAVRFRRENETEYDISLAQKIAEERFKETKIRDIIKNYYCWGSGINLIRIPYWEFDNIESILKRELSKYIKKVA